jgi:ubiquinone/menaquinone biosynthesis C-methylase UbiE
MKRNLPTNINDVQHWNQVFSSNSYTHAEADRLKVEDCANHIEDGKSVVDLGCGTGHFLKAIKDKRKNCECTGLDFSSWMMTTLKQERPDITWVKGDVLKTNLPDESFDYVLSFEVLEHVDEPTKLIAEMARLCKEGGKAILSTPLWDRVPSKEHVWLFDLDDLQSMLETHFSQVWVQPWASGNLVHDARGGIVYPPGNWDVISVKAIK